jgi:disulfide bond formation protein DsbB
MQLLNRIQTNSPRALLLLCGLCAFVPLAGALIGQYGFSLYPCDLCIYQRIPYGFIIFLALVGFFLKNKKTQYIICLLCALLFLVDAGIAGYHTGVELNIFKGPSACSDSGGAGQTLEEMRAAIMNAPLVTCAQAMIHIFGLSMAAWNTLAALASFCLVSLLLLKSRRRV